MRHDEIVVTLWRGPLRYVSLQKSNACRVMGRLGFNLRSRQLQHPRARIHAINFHIGMQPNHFTKKSAVPLTHDERAPRRNDFLQTRDAAALERVTKSDPFQRTIPRRDPVEAHARIPAIRGVSKTKSARAVRTSSLIRPLARSSRPRRIALTHRHAPIRRANG